MTDLAKKMEAILNEAQMHALPSDPTSRSEVIAYCNAAVNSGAGAFERHYGNKSRMADLAFYAALNLWLSEVQKRLRASEAGE